MLLFGQGHQIRDWGPSLELKEGEGSLPCLFRPRWLLQPHLEDEEARPRAVLCLARLVSVEEESSLDLATSLLNGIFLPLSQQSPYSPKSQCSAWPCLAPRTSCPL